MNEESAHHEYEQCLICPRKCGADRLHGQTGFCRMGPMPVVNLSMLHLGEEPVISGTRGSGAVFFEGCSLKCCFCQNYDISRGPTGRGKPMTDMDLAKLYLELQSRGAHNINLITAGHFIPSVAESLKIAKDRGLKIPVAFNCGGYESSETIRILDGLIDIYMPDMKFFSSALSKKYCNAGDYFEICRELLDEMFRQTGPVTLGDDGLLKRGVIVRHLMLPGALFDTKRVLDHLCSRFGNDIYISLMSQYTPFEHKYPSMILPPELKRKLPRGHYDAAADYLISLGQINAFVQGEDSSGDEYLPDFN